MNKSNIARTLVLMTGIMLTTFSCTDDATSSDQSGNWVSGNYYEGQPRFGAVSVVIGNKAYVGLGYDGDDYFSDFYVYDPDRELWDDIAPFPGVARERAVAFAINGKAYVGLGYNRDLETEELRDFWEFDPNVGEKGTWTQLDDFIGTARYNAVGFSIGGRGYVGTGYDGTYYRSDFYSFNPETGDWTETASFKGGKREDALAVVYQGKAYLCGGRNNGSFARDLWVFDPEAADWTELTPDDDASYYDEFTDAVQRYSATAFLMNEKIYIGTGITTSGTIGNDIFEYDPATGKWDEKTEFEGSSRYLAVSFTVNGRGFLGLGQNSSRRWDDFWEFFPTDEYDDGD